MTYLFASHAKAAVIMGLFLWIMGGVAGGSSAPHDVLWTGYLLFVIADALVSILRRRETPDNQSYGTGTPCCAGKVADDRPVGSGSVGEANSQIDTQAIKKQLRPSLEEPLADFIEKNLPDHQGGIENVLILDDATPTDRLSSGPAGLLVSRVRLNDVRRLNRYFLGCADRIPMGGYFVGRYAPLESGARRLRQRYVGSLYWPVFLFHFIWYRAFPKIPCLNALYFSLTKGRNRVVSKVEVWGRLSYCGLNVIAESTGDDEIFLIARRVASPVQNKKPSYYPIVALEKVGLDGEIIRTHKIRTMFPFSEFLQKRIFEDNGLAPTGKFANDFRLTEYGRFLRKYWLDELPQVFDWLRGDVKLFGMRATSRHFLSLYPKELYDLYVQIKPGLIPPIFDESTSGLENIARVEMAYLRSYCDQPLRTDVKYLVRTFTDIVFRGVRSK
jgi:lipopolysaccharide/colanic/teichoic acid biosynthesis glycosyltransferase